MCPGDRKAEFHSPVTFLLRAFGYLSLGFSFLILLKVKLCDRTRAAWSQWDRVCVYFLNLKVDCTWKEPLLFLSQQEVSS